MRAMSWVASLLGLIALLLTISGIYGVMSYLVSQRTKEIGIRLALGATRLGIVRHVLEQSAKVVLIGSAVGLLVAAALSRVIRASVLPVAFDPLVFGIALLFVGFAAAAASVIPARRALRIDPARTLRAE
jgi:putative ABC transport system permease protein